MRTSCPHCHADLEFSGTSPPGDICPACRQPITPGLSDETVEVPPPPVGAKPCESAQPEKPQEPATRLPPPRSLPARFGRYRITGELSSGALATVYRGHDEELKRDVAVRVPHPETVGSPEAIERFLSEGRKLAQLDHPGIVPVYDVGRTVEGWCYQISKYVDGIRLGDRARRQQLPTAEALKIMAQASRALHHAHRRGMIHRNLSPMSILLDRKGFPHITDFGLALEESSREDLRRSDPPSHVYMSPELACDEGHRVDARTDIYSLGAILYELLAGSWPFRGVSRTELRRCVREIEPPGLARVSTSTPPAVEHVCHKAISKRMLDRHSTALDLAEELEACELLLSSAPAPPAPPLTPTPTPGPAAGIASGSAAHAATPPSSSGASIDGAPRIVPKGLRSFDGGDADFFLDLLPGPRSPDGMPESLKFWKSRIEEREPEATFPVGLIYGPSGCGKSSLVKAGLIPRLSGDIVPIYLEATADGTETRLMDRLHRHCPLLPDDLSMRDALSALRRGGGVVGDQKIVLFIDQFEQWLHAHGTEDTQGELVRTLRQCDGQRVQCVLMVRDDFWMGITRFFAELEVPLSEGQNSAAVDLFSPQHTRKVLMEFGRAFGTLPAKDDEFTPAHEDFLEEAVRDLAREGVTIPVRVALFADMVKNRRWTTATLHELGGTEGIGVTFLEETFSADTAPPEHRFHQRAARGVLRALLPEKGTDIKGHMRSREALLVASRYEKTPREFDELLRILDSELRLVTPTDPMGLDEGLRDVSAAGEEVAGRSPSGSYYYLTHDYLVPAIREWLVRKQKETARGRAELVLRERTVTWNTRRERQYLPTFLQWCRIHLSTRKRDWTRSSREMMRHANRAHSIRIGIVGAILALMSWGAVESVHSLRIRALRDQLLYVATPDAGDVIENMAPYRASIEPLLVAALDRAPRESSGRLNLALALLATDPSQVDYMYERALDVPEADFRVVREALRGHRDGLRDRLWSLVENAEAPATHRVRAAMLLATYEPAEGNARERWKANAADLASLLHGTAVDDPSRFNELVRGLAPVGDLLLESLLRMASNTDLEPGPSAIAKNLVVEYAGEYPDILVDVLFSDPSEERAAKIIQKLEQKRDEAVKLLVPVLETSFGDVQRTRDKPRIALEHPGAELETRLDEASGFATGDVALFQTLRLEDFDSLAVLLRDAGFRPLRFRPYRDGKVVRVASVLTRDGRQWDVLRDLDEQAIRAEIQSTEDVENLLVDLSSYENPAGETRYSITRTKRQDGDPERIGFIGLSGSSWDDFRADEAKGFVPVVLQARPDPSGNQHFVAVLEKGGAVTERLSRSPRRYEKELDEELSDLLQIDVDVASTLLENTRDAVRAESASAIRYRTSRIENDPDNPSDWYQRAYHHFVLGMDADALRDVSYVLEKSEGADVPGWQRANSHDIRAVAAARQGLAEDAERYLELAERDGAGGRSRNAYRRCLVSLFTGDPETSLERLAREVPNDPILVAAAYAFAAGMRDAVDADTRRRFADRAVEHIRRARAAAHDYGGWIHALHFGPVLHDPRVQDLEVDGRIDTDTSMLHVRLGEIESARREVRSLSETTGRAARLRYWVVIEAAAGHPDALADLEKQLETERDNSDLRLWGIAAGLSIASRILEEKDPSRARDVVDRAFATLDDTVTQTGDPLAVRRELLTHWMFRPLRHDARFEPLLASLDCQVAGLYRGDTPQFESRETHGLDPRAHLERARELAEAGYRPVSISGCVPVAKTRVELASVWHRPRPSEKDRDDLARKQSLAAVALLRLGESSRFWPLLEDRDDPRLRAFLLLHPELLAEEVDRFLRRLDEEKNAAVRQALLLTLGETIGGGSPLESERPLEARLKEVYRSDPDSGVRAAAGWLLRERKKGVELAEIDRSVASTLPRDGKSWWVTPGGSDLAVVRGPVEFEMGSPPDEALRASDERLHRRQINHGFAIATREVTVREFREFVRKNPGLRYSPSASSPEPECPVGSVSWYLAAQYCRWLSEKEGIPEEEMCYPPIEEIRPGMKLHADYLTRSGYRLPTEAEWEYAARSGARTATYYGSSPELMPRYGWLQESAESRTWPVATLRPNRFGLFDVHGNVQEWCSESYASYPQDKDKPVTDLPPDTSPIRDDVRRVARGASFLGQATETTGRVAKRYGYRPDVVHRDVGFRIARTLPRSELRLVRQHCEDAEKKRSAGDLAGYRTARDQADTAYRQLLAAEPERPDFALAYAEFLLEDTESWTVVDTVAATSREGATLTLQTDGSILASGANPDTDIVTIKARTSERPVFGFRLEALTDPSLPREGPGRASSGNFVLTEFEVFSRRPGASAAAPVGLTDPFASWEQTRTGQSDDLALWAASRTVDGDATSKTRGWAIGPETGRPHRLVVETREPEGGEGETEWTFVLHQHRDNPQYTLGRFRISAASDRETLQAERIRLHLERNTIDAWIRLAAAQAFRGDRESALAALERSVVDDASATRAEQLARAWVLARLGQSAGARNALSCAIGPFEREEIHPEVTMPLAVEVIEWLLEDSADDAFWLQMVDHFTRAAGAVDGDELLPPGASALATSLQLLELRLPNRGLATAEKILEDPEHRNPETLQVLARLQHRAGRLRDAILTLEEARRRAGADVPPAIESRLSSMRREALPSLLTYGSIDAAIRGTVLIPAGATWRFFRGVREPSPGSLEWTQLDFDDSGWEEGASGFGYGDNDDSTVLRDMRYQYTTLYVRRAFDVPEDSLLSHLLLSVSVDDGFIAYLNGEEVGRFNVGGEGPRPFDALAIDAIDNAVDAEPIDLTEKIRSGRNVIALQCVNANATSSDLSLIPVVRGELDTAGAHVLFERIFESGAGETKSPLRLYAEGLLYGLEGAHGEAVRLFGEVVTADRDATEPWLRLGESLRALGRSHEAESRLRAHFAARPAIPEELLAFWAELSAKDLGRDWAEVYRLLPKTTLYTGEGPALDGLWALRSLEETGAIRINCGGEDYRAADGTLWGRDRLSRSSTTNSGPVLSGVQDAILYRRRAWFAARHAEAPHGYRVPLPKGCYAVTLGFGETSQSTKRQWDVKIEDSFVLTDFSPAPLSLETHRIPWHVDDGFLDLEFLHQVGPAFLSTLEIARLSPAEFSSLTREWVERTEHQNPAALHQHALALIHDGKNREAILELEEAARLPGKTEGCGKLLEESRKVLAPDLVSLASIDAALDVGTSPESLEAFRRIAAGDGTDARKAYLDARLLQREGRHPEAIVAFENAIDLLPVRPEPYLRVLESLEHLPEAERATARARLLGRIEEASDVPDRLRDPVRDLLTLESATGVHVDNVLEAVPELAELPETDPIADGIWALREMESRSVVRINSGGEDIQDPNGTSWSRDRFFEGNTTYGNPRSPDIYRSERQFPGIGPGEPAYRIPVPPGPYRVTIHFEESYDGHRERGGRVSDILLEGRKVLRDYDPVPAVGFMMPDARTFTTWVRDGILDIEARPRYDQPSLRGIEVERLTPDRYLDLLALPRSPQAAMAPDSLGALAEMAFEKGRMHLALRLLEATDGVPGFSDAHREQRERLESKVARLLDATLETPEELVRRGLYYAELGRVDAAAVDFDRALSLVPPTSNPWVSDPEGIDETVAARDTVFDRVAARRPDDVQLWIVRVQHCLSTARFEASLPAMLRVVELEPDNHFHWYRASFLVLYAGGEEAYRSFRRRLREKFESFPDHEDFSVVERVAKACALLPLSPEDAAWPLEIFERADLSTARGAALRWFQQARALAVYRAGRYDEALSWVERTLSGERAWGVHAPAHLIAAMCHHHRGHKDRAQASLARAKELLQGQPAPEDGVRQEQWQDWVLCQVLLREATALLADTPEEDLPAP